MRMHTVTVFVPLLIVALNIPLILGVVRRNSLYGFRTRRTLSSDAVWYPANRVAGIAMLIAGLVWLAAGIVLPRMVDAGRVIPLTITIGLSAIALSVIVAVIYTSRLPRAKS